MLATAPLTNVSNIEEREEGLLYNDNFGSLLTPRPKVRQKKP